MSSIGPTGDMTQEELVAHRLLPAGKAQEIFMFKLHITHLEEKGQNRQAENLRKYLETVYPNHAR